MFTADRGLCGSHNSSVQKNTSMLINSKRQKGINCEVVCLGTKGNAFCRRNGYKIYHQTEISERTLNDSVLDDIANSLIARFTSRKMQEIYFIYNEFVSTLVQNTQTIRVLPLLAEPSNGSVSATDMVTEPEEPEFVRQSVKALFNYKLKTALLNSYLSEHAARMTAMDNATNNSEDLINQYAKLRNKARQSTITNELIEIVAGKEAMKS